MPRFEPLDYAILNPSGENYLEWAMNTSVVLKSRGLGISALHSPARLSMPLRVESGLLPSLLDICVCSQDIEEA
ncbi:hypothetical protein F2Q69_00040854 [Brassica cretica]|uniref:Uncharacterized protein n=1 Tax=Brassica cretica TaxID=69181 RepID=A0A8S9ND56_BRACR|nr:hypothetical protein F2Q69_00040854 [Brassica cretica]